MSFENQIAFFQALSAFSNGISVLSLPLLSSAIGQASLHSDQLNRLVQEVPHVNMHPSKANLQVNDYEQVEQVWEVSTTSFAT
eukprot:6285888-Amphidinium_carterae.1